MRSHPFELLKNAGNYCAPDLEYINDFTYIDENGDVKRIFNRVCQLDRYTEEAMVAAAIAGYESANPWDEVTSHPGKEDHCEVPNKGYVALWEENDVVWGLYHHDFKVFLVCSDVEVMKAQLPQSRLYVSKRLLAGLENL